MDGGANTWNPDAGADRQRSIDHPERAVRGEPRTAAVQTRAQGKGVGSPQDWRMAGDFPPRPERVGPDAGAIQRAVWDGAAPARPCRTGDGRIVRAQDNQLARRRQGGGGAVRLGAEQSGEGIGALVATVLEVASVAVGVMLVEGAGVAAGLDGPSRAGLVPGGERRQGRAVERGLGRGEDRAAVLLQQVDRRRPRRPEPVVGSGGDQVDLQAPAAPAEIDVAPGHARPR